MDTIKYGVGSETLQPVRLEVQLLVAHLTTLQHGYMPWVLKWYFTTPELKRQFKYPQVQFSSGVSATSPAHTEFSLQQSLLISIAHIY